MQPFTIDYAYTTKCSQSLTGPQDYKFINEHRCFLDIRLFMLCLMHGFYFSSILGGINLQFSPLFEEHDMF